VAVAQVARGLGARVARAPGGRVYGHPSRALLLVGITGTNGKTTTSYLVEALLRAGGSRPASSHHPNCSGAERRPARQTTPDALELRVHAGAHARPRIRGVAMRCLGTPWPSREWTPRGSTSRSSPNLTQDHLDFHGTLGEYRRAKRRLFELLARSPKPRRTAVINGDDRQGGDGRWLGLPWLTFGAPRRQPRCVVATPPRGGFRRAAHDSGHARRPAGLDLAADSVSTT